ncbi:MAG: hypothetical protein P4N59_04595 [Negativicutes bacterium]|nr:hypothetical protein [Negativicutes bacterium]
MMKTHAAIVSMLRTQEKTLTAEFGVREMGLVSSNVEYKPVSSVCLFVGGLEPSGFERLQSYLEELLGLTVQVIARANANGAFRHVFTQPRP